MVSSPHLKPGACSGTTQSCACPLPSICPLPRLQKETLSFIPSPHHPPGQGKRGDASSQHRERCSVTRAVSGTTEGQEESNSFCWSTRSEIWCLGGVRGPFAPPQEGAEPTAGFLPEEPAAGRSCCSFWCLPDLGSGHIPAHSFPSSSHRLVKPNWAAVESGSTGSSCPRSQMSLVCRVRHQLKAFFVLPRTSAEAKHGPCAARRYKLAPFSHPQNNPNLCDITR